MENIKIISFSDFITLIVNNISIIIIFLLMFLLYNYYTATFDHFREKGIPFIKPRIVFGNIADRVFLRISFHDFEVRKYKHFQGLPFGGCFEGRQPLLIIRDPDLIKNVMIKNFDHFINRNNRIVRSPPAIHNMLTNLKGKEWRNVRGILTPAFSSAKLRGMEKLLEECGKQMCEFLKKRPKNDTDVEMKEFIGRYTLEVIGSCAFGLDCTSLKDPNATFVKIASKFLEMPVPKRALFFFILTFCPGVLKYLPINFFNEVALKHLSDVVLQTKKDRENSEKNRRNDFMQLMLDAAQKEMIENAKEKIMTDDIIQAQAILFLFAGYETTSTLLSFCCSTLCENIEIQDRLRKEIIYAHKKKIEKSIYDIVNEIPLLENVLLETLRKYPPVSRVDRVCTKSCILGETNILIKEGDVVVIPIAGILQDSDYYPDPHIFNPERFSSEEKMKRPSHLFLPFGAGPRNCIGLRFAMMSAKFCLFHLLKDFQLTPCSKTQIPLKFDKKGFLLKSEKGNWMKVEPI